MVQDKMKTMSFLNKKIYFQFKLLQHKNDTIIKFLLYSLKDSTLCNNMKQKHKINRVSSPRCCSVDSGETIQTLLQIYSKWKLETGRKVEREMVGKKGFIRTFFHVRMFPCIPTISLSTFFWVSNFHSKPLLIWSMLSQSDPTIGFSFCIHNLPFNLASKGALQFLLLGCQSEGIDWGGCCIGGCLL